MCNIPLQLPMNEAVNNTHYTYNICMDGKAKSIRNAGRKLMSIVHTQCKEWIESTWSALTNRLLDFTVTLHYTDLSTGCKEHLSSQTSKPSAISVGAHTSKQNTHTIFTSLSFLLYSVHEPYLLHFYCTQQAELNHSATHLTEVVAFHWSVKTWAQIEGGPVDNLVILNNNKNTVTLLLATQTGLLSGKPHTTWDLTLMGPGVLCLAVLANGLPR